MKDIWVLRLSHRIIRDARITTHVALVARAFGAKGLYYAGERDKEFERVIEKVCKTWGGEFKIEYIKNPVSFIKRWIEDDGVVVHLTMYGINLHKVINDIKKLKKILIVVGSTRVPKIYYELSTFNVAVGHQPHSEIAAIAIFLDRIYEGRELETRFSDAKLEIIPSYKGKRIIKRYIKS